MYVKEVTLEELLDDNYGKDTTLENVISEEDYELIDITTTCDLLDMAVDMNDGIDYLAACMMHGTKIGDTIYTIEGVKEAAKTIIAFIGKAIQLCLSLLSRLGTIIVFPVLLLIKFFGKIPMKKFLNAIKESWHETDQLFLNALVPFVSSDITQEINKIDLELRRETNDGISLLEDAILNAKHDLAVISIKNTRDAMERQQKKNEFQVNSFNMQIDEILSLYDDIEKESKSRKEQWENSTSKQYQKDFDSIYNNFSDAHVFGDIERWGANNIKRQCEESEKHLQKIAKDIQNISFDDTDATIPEDEVRNFRVCILNMVNGVRSIIQCRIKLCTIRNKFSFRVCQNVKKIYDSIGRKQQDENLELRK